MIAFGGPIYIANIDNHGTAFHQPLAVDICVIRPNQDESLFTNVSTVKGPDVICEKSCAPLLEPRKIRVPVTPDRAPLLQEFHDFESRRFPHVIDVAAVDHCYVVARYDPS